jgi:hypothetical protein
MMVRATEAAAAWEIVTALVRDVEDRATLAEREARESVSRMDAESATALSSTRGEAEDLARRIALLKGKGTLGSRGDRVV